MPKTFKDESGYPQIKRIFYIDRQIKAGKRVGIAEIRKEANVSKETVLRDIKFMREELKAPIVYSSQAKSYIYENSFELFNFADEKLLIYYVLAMQMANTVNYTPVHDDGIAASFKKLLNRDYLAIADKISYRISEYEAVNFVYMKQLIESMIKKQTVTINYLAADQSESVRRIEPRHIFNYSGKWYVLAYCHKAGEERIFMLSRFRHGINLTDQPFSSECQSDRGEYLDKSFGVMLSNSIQTAVVRFFEPVATNIKNQIWHKDQQVFENADYVEFSLPVSDFGELLGRVLRFGVYCEAVSPPQFRQQWQNAIKSMYERFCRN